jgi:DNA glycosylase AlkZ-like
MNAAIAAARLDNQQVTASPRRLPEDVVAWLGAVQAQDYPAARWALGLRMRDGATSAAIDRALDEGRIIRTHLLRPTWHFVTPADVHWMLELTAPRVRQALSFANRYYELDPVMRTRATGLFERALGRCECLTRAELGAALARGGLDLAGVRLAMVAMHAELDGVICSGPLRGKHMTYTLLSTRAPRPRRLKRDEALGELATRYLQSHGPATIRDFVWWSGLTVADARRSVEIAGAQQHTIDGLDYWTIGGSRARKGPRRLVHLLPIYDEYLVAYRDLEAVPRRSGGRGELQQAVVAGGQVAGTWKPVRKAGGIAFEVAADRRLSAAERRALNEAAARYGRFHGAPASIAAS